MRYLSAILRFFNEEEFIHKSNLPIILSEIYARNPNQSLGEFISEVNKIKTDFFKINRVSRKEIATTVFTRLHEVDKQYASIPTKFGYAKQFAEGSLKISLSEANLQKRHELLHSFGKIKSPHDKLVDALHLLLNRLIESFQLKLHGVKELSGVDLVKTLDDVDIGFQVKSVNDKISEDIIRSQTSKALEFKLSGFVFIYGRPIDKRVETSIQAAYHHFVRVNEKMEMYCMVLDPESFAELLIRYRVNLGIESRN